MNHNIFKFNHYPFLRLNLNNCNFKMNLCNDFKQTYNQLPFDKYITNNTRKRRYANYHVKNIDNNRYSIFHTGMNTFTQEVDDSRKEQRSFELIIDPYHPFLLHFITLNCNILNMNKEFKELSVDVHQVRQVCYPELQSHNSAEGIHQDGADYIVSACVLNRYNILGGETSIYDMEKNRIYTTLLEEDEFVFQDDKNLYHYVTPINFKQDDNLDDIGYRDIIGLDIKIL